MTINADTNIQSVCKAHWGAHYCLLYNSKDDLVSLLTQYFKHGLENNEFCIWVAPDNDAQEKARQALFEAVPYLENSQKKEQIEFANSREWYLKGGTFQSDLISKRWYDKLGHSIGHGYKGMRVTGDLGWHDEVIWQSLVDYETHFNDVIPHERLVVICSYPLEKLTVSKLIDILRSHELAIVKNNGEWHVFETVGAEKTIASLADEVNGLGIGWQEEVPNFPVLYVDDCNGCGLCVEVCQSGLLYLSNEKVAIQRDGTCTWCTCCEAVCPTNAIVCPFEIVLPDSV